MKSLFYILILALAIAVIFPPAKRYAQRTILATVKNNQIAPQSPDLQNQDQPETSNQNAQSISGFQPPLNRARDRVTKKPFGIYITSAISPVQPERFKGYHTGTDFEIFPEELNMDVSIKAICSGKLILKEYASGYGGVAIELCEVSGNPVMVIYGHLKLASITSKADDNLNVGDVIGILGAEKSAETSGERKHLHLGMYLGSAVNMAGYVNSKTQLSEWIDACQYVCFN